MVDESFKILVKKSDGTQVRMTMEEFKLYKQNLQNKSSQSVVPVEDNEETKLEEKGEILQPIKQSVVESPEDDEELFNESINAENDNKIEDIKSEELPVVARDNSLANVAPVKEIFLDEAVYKEDQESKKIKNQKIVDVLEKPVKEEIKDNKSNKVVATPVWGSDDHQSLLEEDDTEVKRHHIYTTLPSSNNDLVNKILSQVSFIIPNDLSGRCQSLVLSRIKDIRTDDQILDYAMRDQLAGGLDFTEDEAGELISIIKQHLAGKYKKDKSDKEKTVTTPKAPIEDLMSPTKSLRQLKTKSGIGKPVLQDVTLPAKVKSGLSDSDNQIVNDKKSVGPLDELRTFDLKDWRRLSNNPVKAGEELLEKFMVLKKDSFISFMDAITAWRESPLYNMYGNILATCINNQEKVKDYLFNQDKTNILSSEEFDELVKVNKNLV